MKIGEFAKLCGTTIPTLRHYAKRGLLCPVYSDKFSGYRYYRAEQVEIFFGIAALKRCGFSLDEIGEILLSDRKQMFFERKRAELAEALRNLELTEKTMIGVDFMKQFNKSVALRENIHLPFADDPEVIGRWQVVEYDGRTDGFAIGGRKRELYFLPNGERYWCYSWTRGFLLFENGETAFANAYRLENRPDGLYMLVDFKSYEYVENGKTLLLVLKKLDGNHYSADSIARKDDIEKPFVDDPRIYGCWKSVSFTTDKNSFSLEKYADQQLFFRQIEFFPDGGCTSVYGDETISGRDMQVWTKGYVLRKWNSSACAYELWTVNGREYLFLEWKSGDYRWGGCDSDYYVFVRA